MSTIITTLKAVLDLDDNQFAARLSRSEQALHAFELKANKSGGALSTLGYILKDVALSAVLAAGALAAISFVGLIKGSVAAEEKMMQLSRSFDFVNESYGELNKDMNGKSKLGVEEQFTRIKNMARGVGADFYQVADAMNKLNVPMLQAGASVETYSDALQGLLVAAKMSGADSIKIERLLTGFSQVAGKGVLQMEELRQQIGEALPAAFVILAQGLNEINKETGEFGEGVEITTGSLRKLVQNSQISAALFTDAMARGTAEYRKLSAALVYTIEGQAANIATTWRTSMADFGNKSGIYTLTIATMSVIDKHLQVMFDNMIQRWNGTFTKMLPAAETFVRQQVADWIILERNIERVVKGLSGAYDALTEFRNLAAKDYNKSPMAAFAFHVTNFILHPLSSLQGSLLAVGSDIGRAFGITRVIKNASSDLGAMVAVLRDASDQTLLLNTGLQGDLAGQLAALGTNMEDFLNKSNPDRIEFLNKKLAEMRIEAEKLNKELAAAIKNGASGSEQARLGIAAQQAKNNIAGVEGFAGGISDNMGFSGEISNLFKEVDDAVKAATAAQISAHRGIKVDPKNIGAKDQSIIDSTYKGSVQAIKNMSHLQDTVMDAFIARETDPKRYAALLARDKAYMENNIADGLGKDSPDEERRRNAAGVLMTTKAQSAELVKQRKELEWMKDNSSIALRTKLAEVGLEKQTQETQEQIARMTQGTAFWEATKAEKVAQSVAAYRERLNSFEAGNNAEAKGVRMDELRLSQAESLRGLEEEIALIRAGGVYVSKKITEARLQGEKSLEDELLKLKFITSAEGQRQALAHGLNGLKEAAANAAADEALFADKTAKALREQAYAEALKKSIRETIEKTEMLHDPVLRAQRMVELGAQGANAIEEQNVQMEFQQSAAGKLQELETYRNSQLQTRLDRERELDRLLYDRAPSEEFKANLKNNAQTATAQSNLNAEYLSNPENLSVEMDKRMAAANEKWAEMMVNLKTTWDVAINEMRTVAVDGLINDLSQGFLDVLSGVKSIGDGIASVFQGLARTVVEMLIKMAAQRLIYWALEKLGLVTSTAMSATAAGAAATAWAPAAYLASVATLGGAAAIGGAALAAGMATSVGMTAGFAVANTAVGLTTAHTGGVFGMAGFGNGQKNPMNMNSDEGLVILQKGEMVIPKGKVSAMSGMMSNMPIMHSGGIYGGATSMATDNVNQDTISGMIGGGAHIVNFFDMEDVNRYMVKNPDAILNVMSKNNRNSLKPR